MAYYRDKPFLDNNSIFANFPAAKNNSAFLKFKKELAGRIDTDG